ncbi:MAG: metalloregulator ArsR/SmtB family transcription factor [Elusimicrobiota bacterium]|jgi:ArsR family transcriptional regulator|nr:metalloregulator ArsR/SmtB family transcription factor [Elusimicrobiota bacterium]
MTKTITCDCKVIHNEILEKVKKKMQKNAKITRLSNLYKMFSAPTRIKILYALNIEKMCVCDLSVLLNMTKSAISHQLRALRLMNLVKYRKNGKIVFYSLADAHIKNILDIGFEHINE